jgi:hypothetical protein
LAYYQGRVSWEDLFPDPEETRTTTGTSNNLPPAIAGVDTSRIQSYQVREFVEALDGIAKDLRDASLSNIRAMKLTLMGTVSPVALARALVNAVDDGRRTPTAAAFQLVEIIACLQTARSLTVSAETRDTWLQLLSNSSKQIRLMLRQLEHRNRSSFEGNTSFHRYSRIALRSRGAHS